MENRESESELNECKKKLNKAHQTIEELKIKMTQDKKNHKWEIREINKRIEQATDKNLELYDRESKALIYADQLEKDKNILVKEKREHKRVAAMNGVDWKTFNWRKLKEKSIELGYGVKKIFDANYGEVNTYHRNVWEAAYPEYEI